MVAFTPRVRQGRRRGALVRCAVHPALEDDEPMLQERSAAFHLGSLFYRPASRITRDLGVLALAVLSSRNSAIGEPPGLRVLDAMSGSGVRALRYFYEVPNVTHVHANDLMLAYGDHPLQRNLQPLIDQSRARMSKRNAVELYMEARLGGPSALFDLVDCDAFGTGQPHTAEAWWAVRRGGLLYLCATDALTTAGNNAGKALVGYAAVAPKPLPSCNEASVRMLMGTAHREAAARGLRAEPIFGFFHRPSSTTRVMLRLAEVKPPTPTEVERSYRHVARCGACGEIWPVAPQSLGVAASREAGRRCGCGSGVIGGTGASEEAGVVPAGRGVAPGGEVVGRTGGGPGCVLGGPMWTAPMHDPGFVAEMRALAAERGWGEAEALLSTFEHEAEAEARGALLFYHLGEVQAALALHGAQQPRLDELIPALRRAGFGASRSHAEPKALKTSASLAELVDVVLGAREGGWGSAQDGAAGQVGVAAGNDTAGRGPGLDYLGELGS